MQLCKYQGTEATFTKEFCVTLQSGYRSLGLEKKDAIFFAVGKNQRPAVPSSQVTSTTVCTGYGISLAKLDALIV